MSHLFFDIRHRDFNADLSNWNVSRVTTMEGMFRNAPAFNGDLGRWKVHNVRNMNSMFDNAASYEGKGLDQWNRRLSSLRFAAHMFNEAAAFNGNVQGWQLPENCSLKGTFRNASLFNRTLSSWTPRERDEATLLRGATSFKNGTDNANWRLSSDNVPEWLRSISLSPPEPMESVFNSDSEVD